MILITLDKPKTAVLFAKNPVQHQPPKENQYFNSSLFSWQWFPAKQRESSILVGELLREISRRHKIVTSTYASRLTSSVKTLNYKAISTRINLKCIFFNYKRIKSSKYKHLLFFNSYTKPKTLYQWLSDFQQRRNEMSAVTEKSKQEIRTKVCQGEQGRRTQVSWPRRSFLHL